MTTTFESGPGRLFIGGQWREAADGARTDVIDPSTGQVVMSARGGSGRRGRRRARRTGGLRPRPLGRTERT
jgi:hypothetical protein